MKLLLHAVLAHSSFWNVVCQRVKAVFPDAGAAALLKYKWKDAAFGFAR